MGDGGEARVPLCAQLLGTLVCPPGKQQVSETDPANRRRSSTPESKLTARGQDQQVSQEAGRRAGLGTARGRGSAPEVIRAGCRRRPSHLGEVATQVKFLVLPQEPSIKRGGSSCWSFQTLPWLLKHTVKASHTQAPLATVSR